MAYQQYAKTGFYKITSKNPEAPHPSFRVNKFTPDLELESSYAMEWIDSKGGGYYMCECPGFAKRFQCRHKEIREAIVNANQVNGEKFFAFETKTFKEAKEIN